MPPGLVIGKIRRAGSIAPLGLDSGETSHPGFPVGHPGLQSSRPCRDFPTAEPGAGLDGKRQPSRPCRDFPTAEPGSGPDGKRQPSCPYRDFPTAESGAGRM